MHAGLKWFCAVGPARPVGMICLSDKGKVTERPKVVFLH